MRKLLAREVPTGVAITHKYERHAAPRPGIDSLALLKASLVHANLFVSIRGVMELDGGCL